MRLTGEKDEVHVSTESLRDLHYRLRQDKERLGRGFSPDLAEVSALLHRPYAEEYEIEDAIRHWCKTRQSCQFGRVAASKGQLHFCILRERDLGDGKSGDKAIAEKIASAKRQWKQRAVTDRNSPPHGFLLVFGSPHVMEAAADDNLRRFASRLLELSGWRPERRARRGENTITSDFLYLKNPQTLAYHGFRFNLDFFASAGDSTWWHDHRFPGGIAFTANATGHMKAFMDWYSEPGRDHGAWAVTQAMMTIARSHPTRPTTSGDKSEKGARAEGRVTWLLDVNEEGKPIVPRLQCPLEKVPEQLVGKDWTKYEGLLHTDNAVREEFFDGREQPLSSRKPPLMDFTYLYDSTQPDFKEFTAGRVFTEDEVYADIDSPENWTHREAVKRLMERTPEQAAEVFELMSACFKWGLIKD
jgi:hypothetical protein